jgi:hypothetical protein
MSVAYEHCGFLGLGKTVMDLSSVCGAGTAFRGGKCVSTVDVASDNASVCGAGTAFQGGKCVSTVDVASDNASVCGAGTTYQNGKCMSMGGLAEESGGAEDDVLIDEQRDPAGHIHGDTHGRIRFKGARCFSSKASATEQRRSVESLVTYLDGHECRADTTKCGEGFSMAPKIMQMANSMNCVLEQSASQSGTELSSSTLVTQQVLSPGERDVNVIQNGVRADMTIPSRFERLISKYNRVDSGINNVKNSRVKHRDVRLKERLLGGMESLRSRAQSSLERDGVLEIMGGTVPHVEDGVKLKTLSYLRGPQNEGKLRNVTHSLKKFFKASVLASANEVFNLYEQTITPYMAGKMEAELYERDTDITASIVSSILDTHIDVKNALRIVVTTPDAISVDNALSSIDANTELDLVTSSLATASVDLGRDIAEQILSDSLDN